MSESMAEMAVISLGGEQAYIEVSSQEENCYEYHNNASRNEKGMLQIDGSQMNQLVKIGKALLGELKEFEADEAEVSFGIKAGGEGSLLCFAKANAEAQFNVKLTWKRQGK